MRIALPFAIAMLIVAMPADARPAPKPSGATYHYKCPKGRAFSVRYDRDYAMAFVDFGRKHYRLPAAMSASGSRYAKGRVEFWEHHGEAMLIGVRGGDLHDCKTRRG
jgi:membrane-bound inhibitor of C-type lysozyme